MPPSPRVEGPDLVERIRVLWNRAFTLSPPDIPRGVTRFRTIDDANQARFDSLIARMRRTSSPDRPHAEGGGRAGGKLAAADSNVVDDAAPGGGQDGGPSSAG